MFGEDLISWENTVVYLGVKLDKKLTWAPHITGSVRKAKAAKAQLMPLVGRRSKLSVKNKLLLYKAVIRPAMMYGSEIWGAAAKSHLKKLQVVQNQMLRTITNAPYFVRNTQLHDDLQVEGTKKYIRDKALKLYMRCAEANNPEVRSLGQYDPSRSRRCPKVIITNRYEQEWEY